MQLPEGKIDIFIRDRICSRCYGDLMKRFAPGRMYEAFCPQCGDAWGGTTISRRYAERLGQENLANYWAVKYNPALRDILPGRTSKDQAMTDLGLTKG